MRIKSNFVIKRNIKSERHFFKFQLITLTFMTGFPGRTKTTALLILRWAVVLFFYPMQLVTPSVVAIAVSMLMAI